MERKQDLVDQFKRTVKGRTDEQTRLRADLPLRVRAHRRSHPSRVAQDHVVYREDSIALPLRFSPITRRSAETCVIRVIPGQPDRLDRRIVRRNPTLGIIATSRLLTETWELRDALIIAKAPNLRSATLISLCKLAVEEQTQLEDLTLVAEQKHADYLGRLRAEEEAEQAIWAELSPEQRHQAAWAREHNATRPFM